MIDSRSTFLLLCSAVLATTSATRADDIDMTRSMSISTIVEHFNEDESIRLGIEFGVVDLKGFRNRQPDELYERMGHDPLWRQCGISDTDEHILVVGFYNCFPSHHIVVFSRASL